MNCSVESRDRVRRAADAIWEYEITTSVDVLSPVESQYDLWTLDVVLQTTGGVPPSVLRELALADLRLRPTPSQGRFEHVAATV